MTNTVANAAPGGFDPLSAEYLRDPHEYWQSVGPRPAFFYEPLQCWVLTRHADVGAAFRDWQTFSSRTLRAIPLPSRSQVPADVQAIPPKLMACAFINMDPPQHTVDRKSAQKAFTRPLVTASEEYIETLANELIDSFAADGRCDLMTEFCHPLTLGVIGRMLGLPADTMPQFRTWVDDFFGLMMPGQADAELGDDVPLPVPVEELEARYRRLGEAYSFFKGYLDDRRDHPGDDLASAMVRATNADGAPAMSQDHVLTHILELAAAGSETTATLIGEMVSYFSAHPDVLREVLADPELWEPAVEEGLRRWTIANSLLRVTTRDVEVEDVVIPQGSAVLLNLSGANSDASEFDDPLTFDVHRENARDHLAFGVGRHFCLGAPLARVEARRALIELYRRLPDVATDPSQPLDYTSAVTVRGLKSLPVTWSA